MNIQENISLSEYTTFKIGGSARFFLTVESKEDLIEAVDFSKSKKLSYFILGGGSNLLISDKGYNGAVIKINNKQQAIDDNIIVVGAGVKLSDLVNFSVENNLTGLEWAAGIPGTVGGAVRGNAGAFGCSISEAVVEVLSLRERAEQRRSNLDCEFAYRDSIFKRNSDIIFSAELKLQKGNKEYGWELVRNNLKQRREKHPLECASAGCVFKNPKPMSAADLIEQCGLKGRQAGRAKISEKHANFIVNFNRAGSNDVAELIKIIKKQVKDKFDLELEEEIQYLGLTKQ